MSDFLKAKEAIGDALRETGVLAEKLVEPALAQMCWSELERLLEERLSVVVCGEFKMGKSTLINALLGIPEFVPTDFDIATATVIMIRRGDKLKAYVVPASGEAPLEINVSEISKFACESTLRTLDPPKMVLVEAPSPILEGGLTIVDTPGIGGINRAHSEVTFTVMAEADLVLFVSDAQSPLTTNELNFISSRILPLNRSFALIQTKIDMQARFEEVREANKAKLRSLLACEPTILAVSSINKADFIKTGNPANLEDSGFPALESLIARTLRQNGQARIVKRAVDAAVSAITKMIEPRRIEILALNGPGSPEFLAVEKDLKTTRAQMERLRQEHSQWRNRLSLEISDLRDKTVNRGLAARLTEIDTKLRITASNTAASGEELNVIARGLEEEVKHALVTTCREIADGVEDIRSILAVETGLPLTPMVRGADPTVRPAPTLRTDMTRGWATKAGDWISQWRKQFVGGTTFGAIGGSIVGAFIGFFAGGVGALPGAYLGAQIGGGLGGMTGAGTGIVSANKFLREKGIRLAREVLESQLGPYLRLVSKECMDNCHELLGEMKAALTREFDLRIKDALIDLEYRDEALKRGLLAEREAMKARKDVLVGELRTLEDLKARPEQVLIAFKAGREA